MRDGEGPRALSKRSYLTLDTSLNRSLAASEPAALLAESAARRMTIDEVQRAPDLLLAIKEEVDRNKGNGRFLLIGSVNRSKRLVKSPKLYWSDTGLALHLAQLSAPTGAHLENIVCTDLLAWREVDPARPAILYWRRSTGDEVDFLIERRGQLLPVEVKATENPGYNDSKGLRAFRDEYRTML